VAAESTAAAKPAKALVDPLGFEPRPFERWRRGESPEAGTAGAVDSVAPGTVR
jgi:hypothetical protein